MNKADFTKLIAEKAECTIKDTQKFLAAFEDVMINEIFANNDKVAFKFGSLAGVEKETSERQARNPQNGAILTVPAKKYNHLPKLSVPKSVKESCQIK